MPLRIGKSRKIFSSNVSKMMHEGYPQKQALAASYAAKRKAMRRGKKKRK